MGKVVINVTAGAEDAEAATIASLVGTAAQVAGMAADAHRSRRSPSSWQPLGASFTRAPSASAAAGSTSLSCRKTRRCRERLRSGT